MNEPDCKSCEGKNKSDKVHRIWTTAEHIEGQEKKYFLIDLNKLCVKLYVLLNNATHIHRNWIMLETIFYGL